MAGKRKVKVTASIKKSRQSKLKQLSVDYKQLKEANQHIAAARKILKHKRLSRLVGASAEFTKMNGPLEAVQHRVAGSMQGLAIHRNRLTKLLK